ncbi:quinoprotein relay system zinc metallohydrolase 2 [Piscinibacter sp. XHJ-5]|uniref:quinoprotein relay system zinc metallohydrolase 2 n=1 Tax=Piscinibacter sp. XHJ-5 TaxID=3037797 RepID=UPI002452B05C|nr:quinoprotein relay system zinc metallohydrolase 2 [Piscinibacter sp. XHJ-5]
MLLLAGVALAALAAPLRADPETLALQPQRLAEGVYHVAGRHAVWGPANHGHVANSGFVVGERCIAVIDGGGSPTAGRALLEAVRRTSALPVCYVISTHAHPDHVLGNAAFVDAATQFVGHHRLAAALAARGPFYLNVLRRDFDLADRLDAVVMPTVAVETTRELDLGGRTLELRAWPTAHTDNDLTVLDRRSGTLWLGDLVFIGHLPVLDGRLRGWRAVLDTLRAWQPVRAVPGHGPVIVDWPAGMVPTATYLKQLETEVRGALREGLTLAEAVERLGAAPASRLAGWQLGDDFHRRNLTAAYAELEWSE